MRSSPLCGCWAPIRALARCSMSSEKLAMTLARFSGEASSRLSTRARRSSSAMRGGLMVGGSVLTLTCCRNYSRAVNDDPLSTTQRRRLLQRCNMVDSRNLSTKASPLLNSVSTFSSTDGRCAIKRIYANKPNGGEKKKHSSYLYLIKYTRRPQKNQIQCPKTLGTSHRIEICYILYTCRNKKAFICSMIKYFGGSSMVRDSTEPRRPKWQGSRCVYCGKIIDSFNFSKQTSVKYFFGASPSLYFRGRGEMIFVFYANVYKLIIKKNLCK